MIIDVLYPYWLQSEIEVKVSISHTFLLKACFSYLTELLKMTTQKDNLCCVVNV